MMVLLLAARVHQFERNFNDGIISSKCLVEPFGIFTRSGSALVEARNMSVINSSTTVSGSEVSGCRRGRHRYYDWALCAGAASCGRKCKCQDSTASMSCKLSRSNHNIVTHRYNHQWRVYSKITPTLNGNQSASFECDAFSLKHSHSVGRGYMISCYHYIKYVVKYSFHNSIYGDINMETWLFVQKSKAGLIISNLVLQFDVACGRLCCYARKARRELKLKLNSN